MGPQVNKPFGPALNAALAMLMRSFHEELNQLLAAEAKSLHLAAGFSVDIEGRQWTWPAKKSAAKSKTGKR